MPGKEVAKITVTELAGSARQYRKELVDIPRNTIKSLFPYMTVRDNIRFEEVNSQIIGGGQLAPFNALRESSNRGVEIISRKLKTYQGNSVDDFVPEDVLDTIYGKAEDKGTLEEIKKVPIAKLILAYETGVIAENVYDEVFTAKRNPGGDTTHDLFNGFKTIGDAEILSGGLSEEKKNLYKPGEIMTDLNACDIIDNMVRNMNVKLRTKQKTFMYISPDNMLKYEHCYRDTKGSLNYNDKFEQYVVPGTGGLCKFAPMSCIPDDVIITSPKENMLIGMAAEGEGCNVDIRESKKYYWAFAIIASMFIGVDFRTLAPEYLQYTQLSAGA